MGGSSSIQEIVVNWVTFLQKEVKKSNTFKRPPHLNVTDRAGKTPMTRVSGFAISSLETTLKNWRNPEYHQKQNLSIFRVDFPM